MGLFEIESEHFGGEVKVIRPTSFPDERGSLTVTYLEDEFQKLGLPKFVRQMHTWSEKSGVLRGLHFQWTPAMGKLIQVLNGAIFQATVDLRIGSPTFLDFHSSYLLPGMQIWAPSGFARGYYTITDNTVVQYSCDAYYGEDHAIRWDDSDININWPWSVCGYPKLSERDAAAPTVQEYFGRSK